MYPKPSTASTARSVGTIKPQQNQENLDGRYAVDGLCGGSMNTDPRAVSVRAPMAQHLVMFATREALAAFFVLRSMWFSSICSLSNTPDDLDPVVTQSQPNCPSSQRAALCAPSPTRPGSGILNRSLRASGREQLCTALLWAVGSRKEALHPHRVKRGLYRNTS